MTTLNFENEFQCRKIMQLFIIVADTSTGMYGEKINTINNLISNFYSDIQKGEIQTEAIPEATIELAVIRYDKNVSLFHESKFGEDFGDEVPPLLTVGNSASNEIVLAIEQAIQLANERKAFYRKHRYIYYCPKIVVMTGCEPSGNHSTETALEALSARINEETRLHKKYWILGYNADRNNKSLTDTLYKICGRATDDSSFRLQDCFFWLIGDDCCARSNSNEDEKVSFKEGLDDTWMDSFEL